MKRKPVGTVAFSWLAHDISNCCLSLRGERVVRRPFSLFVFMHTPIAGPARRLVIVEVKKTQARFPDPRRRCRRSSAMQALCQIDGRASPCQVTWSYLWHFSVIPPSLLLFVAFTLHYFVTSSILHFRPFVRALWCSRRVCSSKSACFHDCWESH